LQFLGRRAALLAMRIFALLLLLLLPLLRLLLY
jgi:hypothetical protein